MSKARNMADLLDSNGDVVTGALDNVPPSNDASALTTGTLSADRLGAGSIAAAKLADTYLTGVSTGDLPSGTLINQKFYATNTKTRITDTSGVLMSTTYTPTYSNSVILVTMNVAGGRGNINGVTGIRRNGSFIGSVQVSTTYAGTAEGLNSAEDSQHGGQTYQIFPTPYTVLDTPNTTSSVTYDWYFKLSGGSGYYNFNRQETDNGGNAVSTILIQEFAG